MIIDIAIVGATGIVGQKVIALLLKENNNNLNIKELTASDKNIYKRYVDATKWQEPLINLPEKIANINLCSIDDIKSKFIISCLPSEIALSLESNLIQKGKIVFSNASTFRMNENVPILIPEINLESLNLLKKQNELGKIVTNSNCSTSGIVLTLAPLMEENIIDNINIVTLQSISGAGYFGVFSMEILNNTLPYINNEPEKIIDETKKILQNHHPNINNMIMTVTTHRVPILYGHTITLHIVFKENVEIHKIIECYKNWNKKYPGLFMLYNDINYPQINKHLKHDDMCIHIGKVQHGEKKNIIKIVSLVHNLVRGAAGAAITNMQHYIKYFGCI